MKCRGLFFVLFIPWRDLIKAGKLRGNFDLSVSQGNVLTRQVSVSWHLNDGADEVGRRGRGKGNNWKEKRWKKGKNKKERGKEVEK